MLRRCRTTSLVVVAALAAFLVTAAMDTPADAAGMHGMCGCSKCNAHASACYAEPGPRACPCAMPYTPLGATYPHGSYGRINPDGGLLPATWWGGPLTGLLNRHRRPPIHIPIFPRHAWDFRFGPERF